jgi:hypothetical protein
MKNDEMRKERRKTERKVLTDLPYQAHINHSRKIRTSMIELHPQSTYARPQPHFSPSFTAALPGAFISLSLTPVVVPGQRREMAIWCPLS